MRRIAVRSLLIAAVASVALASGTFASSAFPFRFPAGSITPFTAPANTGFCAFDLHVEDALNNVHGVVTPTGGGGYKLVFQGDEVTRFTDLANGHSMLVDAPAAVTLTFDANDNLLSFTLNGLSVVMGPFGPVQDSGVYQYSGSVDALTGARTGTRTDICAALAV